MRHSVARKCFVVGLAQALLFAQAYALDAPAGDAPVLRLLMRQYAASQRPDRGALDAQAFAAAKDKMLARLDEGIQRLKASSMDDRTLRARAERRFRAAAKTSRQALAKFVQTLPPGQVEKALAAAQRDARYRRCLARHRDARAAVLACLALDLQAREDATRARLAKLTKARLLADMQAARARLAALAYDGSDYDEYFEFTWYVFTSDEALLWALWPALLVADVCLTPVVFAYKMAHWLLLD